MTKPHSIMKAYLCLYLGLFYPNVVLSFSTFGLDSVAPVVMNKGTNEIVVQAQEKTNDHVIKPIWVKKTDWLYDSKKPFISNNLGGHIDTEIKGQSERSDDQGIVSNIGEPRQPGSIFFNPYWISQAKNPLYHDNNGFIYQPDKNGFHNQPGYNGFNNHPGQNGIYTASKGSIVQIGKGNSQLWKPQYVGNKGANKHPGHTPLSGSKGYKQSNNFQIGKSFYSLSRDTLNSTHPKGKKKVPYKLRNSPYNSIHRFQSSTQNPGGSGFFSVDVRNKKWNQLEKSNPVIGKPDPLQNIIKYSKREGPIKKHQENQETNWLPNIFRSALNSSSYDEGNGNDAQKPSEAKIRVHPYRHKRSTNENNNEETPAGQFWAWNTDSLLDAGNLIPVRHSLNRFDLGDYELNTDQPLEMNTLRSDTTADKRVRPRKGHSWHQRDLNYSGNLIHPARHSLNPIILGAKGLNMLHPETLNSVYPGGRNTNHPDEQSNGNSANQNLDVERNIHYPDITGMKNVHPKDLLHYLRILRVLVEPSTSSFVPTVVEEIPNATKVTPHVLDWKDASKWGGILFRSSPKNGTRSRFMSFPLGPSNILRDDDDGPVKYRFHFGGILWWG